MNGNPQKYDRKASVLAICLTVAIHLGALLFCNFSGFKYIYPPPEEKSILIDFTEEAPLVTKNESKPAPAPAVRSEETVPAPAKQSVVESVGEKAPSNEGDVEVPAKMENKPVTEPEEEIIDTRALFRGGKSSTQTTSADTTARSKGLPNGRNGGEGVAEGTGNWSLEGRRIEGRLPSPTYSGGETGTVVIRIWVDMYGSVEKAEVVGDKTTVTSKQLWQAAREAALKTRFRQDINHPELQEGSITYVFSLR